MKYCNTILGKIPADELGRVLTHEHIGCFYEHFLRMAGDRYMDLRKVEDRAVEDLTAIREKYDIRTVVDCTPVNIGRNLDLIKRVSERSGVHIVFSTGLYYTEEPLLWRKEEQELAEPFLRECQQGAEESGCIPGVLKFAVEEAEMSVFLQKALRALCIVHRNTGTPLCIHTHGVRQNGRAILRLLETEQIAPDRVTLSHVSDAHDLNYLEELARAGCYLGFDRIYPKNTPEYLDQTARELMYLMEKGYLNQLLLSHDQLIFNGFEQGRTALRTTPQFNFISRYLLPELRRRGVSQKEIDTIQIQNPREMLVGKEEETEKTAKNN